MKNFALFTAIMALPLLFGCQGKPSEDTAAASAATLEQICDVEWLLQSIEQDGRTIELVPDSVVTFQCTGDGKVAGAASVNRYFGSFTLVQPGQLEWAESGFGSTMMAGPQPLMEQEQLYLSALVMTRRFDLQDQALVLQSDNNSLAMRFTRNANQ